MTYQTLSVTLENHIATVRLNRPEKANAMNAAMWQEIRQAFEWVDRTPEARVAVLQGEGKLFCAGIDLQMQAVKDLERIEKLGLGTAPVCMAKTQMSFSADPSVRGAPSGHTLNVREVRTFRERVRSFVQDFAI